jgi:hypothetical protein
LDCLAKMVEAVGVEPTSSAPLTGATTCLVHFWVSPASLPMDRPRRAPVFMLSVSLAGPKTQPASYPLSSFQPASGVAGETSRSIRPRVPALRWQLFDLSGVYRGLRTTSACRSRPRHRVESVSPPEIAMAVSASNIADGGAFASPACAAARAEKSMLFSVGGGADRDGVGGIRTADSQPVTCGLLVGRKELKPAATGRTPARRTQCDLRTPRRLLNGQPWNRRRHRLFHFTPRCRNRRAATLRRG